MCICTECGKEFQGGVRIRTQQLRYCPHCLHGNEWPLKENAKPVGWCVDKDLRKENDNFE